MISYGMNQPFQSHNENNLTVKNTAKKNNVGTAILFVNSIGGTNAIMNKHSTTGTRLASPVLLVNTHRWLHKVPYLHFASAHQLQLQTAVRSVPALLAVLPVEEDIASLDHILFVHMQIAARIPNHRSVRIDNGEGTTDGNAILCCLSVRTSFVFVFVKLR